MSIVYPRGGVGPDPECLVGCKGNIEWGVGGLDSRGVQSGDTGSEAYSQCRSFLESKG